MPISVIIAIIIVSIILLIITIYYIGLFILSLFIEIPEITDRNVTTCYGDNITLSRRVEFDYEIYYSAICEEQFLFAASPDYSNYYYYPAMRKTRKTKTGTK